MMYFHLGLTISANGKDLTQQFENANYPVLTSNISIRWDNGKISALFLKPCKYFYKHLQKWSKNSSKVLVVVEVGVVSESRSNGSRKCYRIHFNNTTNCQVFILSNHHQSKSRNAPSCL